MPYQTPQFVNQDLGPAPVAPSLPNLNRGEVISQALGGARQVFNTAREEMSLFERMVEDRKKKAREEIDANFELARKQAEERRLEEKLKREAEIEKKKQEAIQKAFSQKQTGSEWKPKQQPTYEQTYGEQGAKDIRELESGIMPSQQVTGYQLPDFEEVPVMGPRDRNEMAQILTEGGALDPNQYFGITDPTKDPEFLMQKAQASKGAQNRANAETATKIRDSLMQEYQQGKPVSRQRMMQIIYENDPTGMFIGTQDGGRLLSSTSTQEAIKNSDLAAKRFGFEVQKETKESQAKGSQTYFDTASKLADQFEATPGIKELQKAKTQVASANNLMQKYKAGQVEPYALDQALGYAFNKTLDATSVVMPGEFERIAQGKSWGNKVQAWFESGFSGGLKLTDQERNDMLQVMNEVYGIAKNQLKPTYDYYLEAGNRYRIDPYDILRGYSNLFDEKTVAPTIQPPQNPRLQQKQQQRPQQAPQQKATWTNDQERILQQKKAQLAKLRAGK